MVAVPFGPVRSGEIAQRPRDDNTASPIASGAKALAAGASMPQHADRDQRHDAGSHQRCAARADRALPCQQRPETAPRPSGARNNGAKVRLKYGAPTEILSPVRTSSASGLQRSDEHGRAGTGEQQVI